MDRTLEFKQIVNLQNTYQKIPTKQSIESPFFTIEEKLATFKQKIQDNAENVDLIKQSFGKLENTITSSMLFELRQPYNLQDETFLNNTQEAINHNLKTYLSQLHQIYSEYKDTMSPKFDNEQKETSSKSQDQNLAAILQEETTQMNDESFLREQQSTFKRKSEFSNKNKQQKEQIESQINELGHIMCNISLHVQAQGEDLKRIDDTTAETETFLRKTYFELNRTWRLINSKRGGMVTFFVFWLIVCLILYIIKKINQ